ncbi:Spo0E family sporulation regulatory protein-aspartic acid phosphatase [Brevibacillus sp. SYSU BS000544]|uniref:Spo0E family sporulation regulatory protein-aspartic acid phosphatase n=1 Tax=Brevibacillus sp. SYSU BS000544 TaxID=3416443 RepID=UPI003CE4B024
MAEQDIPQYIAKVLLEKYLLDRLDFKRLEETFRFGEEMASYLPYLTREDQITYYFKMSLHAFNTKRYKQCVELTEIGIELSREDSELKARAYIAMINSLLYLGEYDGAESYLQEFEAFPYDFVQETAELSRACIKAKKKEYDVAIPMLKKCLNKIRESSRIHVVNDLLEIYLDIGDYTACAELIEREKEFLTFEPDTPFKHYSLGLYFHNKAFILTKLKSFEIGKESYLKSLISYGEVNAIPEITACMNDILSHYTFLLQQMTKEKALLDDTVVQVSQELDCYIVKYQQLVQRKYEYK